MYEGNVNIADEVCSGIYLNTGLHVGDSHIGIGVIPTCDMESDRASLAVADYSDILNVSVRRAAVCAVLDVDADKGILDVDECVEEIARAMGGAL